MAKINLYDSGNIGCIRFMRIRLSEYSSDNSGNIYLSPELATVVEINYHTDKLIEDLNQARNLATTILEEKE